MSILDNAKGIAEAVHQINNLELYQRVLALHSDIIGVVEENIKLRADIIDLKKKSVIKGKLRAVGQSEVVYYLHEADGTKDGPFCTTCWDVDGKLVRVRDYGDHSYSCSYCLTRMKGRQ
jgi:hypothetical protein